MNRIFLIAFSLLALSYSIQKSHAQGADEPIAEQEAADSGVEDQIVIRGSGEVETLWDKAKDSVEGEARRDLAEIRPAATRTALPATVQINPANSQDDDSIATIESEVDQLAASATAEAE